MFRFLIKLKIMNQMWKIKNNKNLMIRIALIGYCFSLLFIASCAFQQAPSGGPPDKTPPEILETEPLNSTLNFKKDVVSFRFSKYMSKSTVIDNLNISPECKYDFSWSGKSLEIEFLEKLDTNTTYTINFGTEMTDLKGNKPTESYSFIFSTGNKLDSSIIKGILYDKRPEGVYVFGYKIDKLNPDTLNILKVKPDYRIQVGSSGKFELKALKSGTYRLFAIKDINKDGIYDEGTDVFSSSTNDVKITDSNNTGWIAIRKGDIIDKIGPMLYSAEAVSRNRIIASFSKPIDKFSVSGNSFSLTDSLGKKDVQILSAFCLNNNSQIEIRTKTNLDTLIKWKLTCTNEIKYSVKDTSNNTIQDSARTTYFTATSDIDTVKRLFPHANLKDSTKGVPTNFKLILTFNQKVDSNSIFKSDAKLISYTKDTLDLLISSLTENILQFESEKLLSFDKKYTFKLNLIHYLGKDTNLVINFQTLEDRDNGSASGTIIDSSHCKGPYIIEFKNKTTEKSYFTKSDSSNNWFIDKLPQDNYHLECFCDSDNNGNYSFGSAFPFAFAEKFIVIPNDITIKARWKVDNIKINFNAK